MKRPLILVLLVLLLVNGLLAFYYFFRLRPRQEQKALVGVDGQKMTFFCPVPKEYCSKGKVAEFGEDYVGVGYQVPEGTPVLAVFSGQIKNSRVTYSSRVGGGQFPGLVLTNFDSDFRVHYVLTGKDDQTLANVLPGEEILLARPGEIAGFGVNLLISVTDSNRKRMRLEPKDFLAN